jgi:peptidoglycan/xylan/chitin deacetylase (PgdA/CDA1 family)
MQLDNLFSRKGLITEILRQEGCANYITDYVSQEHPGTMVRPFSDNKDQIKIFSGVMDKNPVENVSRVNKALLREMVIDSVKRNIFLQDLPYIHLDYYPRGYRTLCAFRVDCDVTERESFYGLLQHSAKHELPLTWFIDVGAQKSYLKDIAGIRKDGHDVQLHCYEHRTYRTYRDNERNIRMGKDLLENAGIPVKGFASPYGRWNLELNRVLEDLKFTYSSEFAVGYDDIPFNPCLRKRISGVLQIPVHPICIGSLKKAGCLTDEMNTYFERIIRTKYERNSPIILYGHPKNEMDKFPEAVDFIFSRLKEKNDVWLTTMTEFAEWWQKRLMVDFKISIENGYLTIITDNVDPTLQLHIERADSTETRLPLINGKYSLMDLKWQEKETILSLPTTEIGHIPKRRLRNIAGKLLSHIRSI